MSFRSAANLGGSLKSSSPRRFEVSKSRDEHASEGVSLLRDCPNPDEGRGSEPPPTLRTTASDSLFQARSRGSTGRFHVTGLEERKDAPDATDESEKAAAVAGTRSVHFSVGEKADKRDELNASGREDSIDHNTTVNMKSWRNMKTLEHPPIIDFYRNSVEQAFNTRPSMIQLIHGEDAGTTDTLEEFKSHNDEIFDGPLPSSENSPKLEKFDPPQAATRTKFGWIQGVFVRCLLNIFGVMLYLRVSWVAGQCGILLGSAVVLLASLVTVITAISTCAICTNGDVKGGGAYFLISRSLGPEFGGSIGLIFSVANAVGAAMYVVGFAETVRDLMKEYGMAIIDGDMMDVRIVGLITCCILMGIVFIGTGFESKMQMGLLVILVLSILNYMLGTLLPVTEEQKIRGITGYSYATLMENMKPAFRDGYNFFSVFAIYFPAATGIMAGANISGDLADPQHAIPLGTLFAIFVTTIIYLITIWMTGSTAVRDADGVNLPTLLSSLNASSLSGSFGTYYVQPACVANNTCTYGLMNYFQVMETESLWGPLITAGIFAATLSSALASLVSAPKVFQAVCKDRLFPYINVFAKQYGKDEEPRRAYLLAFGIAMVMILIGDLNAIAPIISNFFLASYALINYACFDASFADSPGFRPAFKFYNMWVSFAGALLCICVMFIISWWTALITFFCFIMLFSYILHRKPDVNWGSSTQAHSYKNALQGMVKLTNTDDHVKNFRPQILVLSGNPMSRSPLVDFVYNISKGTSLMICGYVIPYKPSDRAFALMKRIDRHLQDYFKKRHIKSFYHTVANPSLRAGTQTLIQTAGLGKLRPNIVIVGFKTDWYTEGVDGLAAVQEYFGIIQDAFDSNMGVGVLRNSAGGLDYTEELKTLNVCDSERAPFLAFGGAPPPSQKINHNNNNAANGDNASSDLQQKLSVPSGDVDVEKGSSLESEARNSSFTSFADLFPFELFDDEDDLVEDELEEADEKDQLDGELDVEAGRMTGGRDLPRSPVKEHHSLLRRRSTRRHTAAQKELLATISRFQRKIKKGRIDVWWLYDDGGLTLLIPHLLTIPKSYLENAEMRVFTISTSTKTMEQEQRSMAALLSKFRIDFANVSVIPDIGRLPNEATFREFENLIAPFRCGSEEQEAEGMITDAEIQAQKDKTRRQLRTAELLQQHSTEADLVVLTLPVPRKGMVSSTLYLAWLEMMTRNLPPTLMIRGNQSSVLTFYS
ncbi:hypothetical protein QR680_005854 [Steinernema hermaphroditum]|uniref:Uncharacterized protein n=1 Tax=Steinernema hermaphroditum TaxID=289476 RepID=A0AA39HTK8_9BILA|nr:hypothetical protein QR680_005854 [Steinernema hermaphroditum]